jgi:membrane associated rhomboid family serine protease
MAGIIDELKQTYKQGSSLIRIIFLNLGVFFLFQIIHLIFFISGNSGLVNFMDWFAVPSYLPALLLKPWTIITYMFYHEEIWHIVFNLLWLYWFGKIFLYFFDDKKLTALYLIGGVVGAVFYIAAYNLLPVFHPVVMVSAALGASAAIMAIIFAVSFYAPDYKIMLLFFGEVKLIYIALVSVLLDLIMMSSGNAGGHIAHLGGAFAGWLWSVQYRKGNDFTKGVTKVLFFMGTIFKRNPRLKVSHKKPVSDLEYNRSKVQYQKEVDRILDKISKGGYESLSKEEKELLFKMSDKRK